MTHERVGEPWVENGDACVQIRIPRGDGSNVEPIARVPLDALRSAADDGERAALMAAAIRAEAARHAPPDPAADAEPPDAVGRFLASFGAT